MIQAPPLPFDVRRLPGGVIEIVPWILPMRLDRAQQKSLVAVLTDGADQEEPQVT